jgi:serine/threonine protein kinase/ribosomal protein L17
MLVAEQILQKRYQLKQQLGNNPGRQTWLALDLATEPRQSVIVKLLPFRPQTQWDDLKLFEREAQVLKHLNHPRIPRYRDYFSVEKEAGEGLPWFGLVQDYINGSSLQELLKSGKNFTEAEAKEIATQLLNILIYLHELSPSVLHRDIKPSNIICGKDGQVYLVDFGAVQDRAKAEGVTFTVVGTGGYAPPEQLWGRAVSASDLYALGATLIHLLTGTAPAHLPQHRMRLQFKDKVSLTPSFARWIEQCTAPAPEQRFSQARQALSALQANSSGSEATVSKAHYGRIGGLALLQYAALFVLSLAVPYFWVYHRYSAETEARQNTPAIARAQEAYFLESAEFAENLSQVGIGIKPQTINYDYSIRATPLAVFNYATPRDQKPRGYVSAVFLTTGKAGEILTVTIVCQANSRGITRPADPIVRGNTVECGFNTKERSGSNPLVIGEDSALAYSAVDDATALRYDQAIEKAQTIKNAFFRAKVLAAIAGELAATDQKSQAVSLLSQSLKVAHSIQEGYYKASALKAIAEKLVENGQYDQALKVAHSIQDDSSKASALRAMAEKLAKNGQYDQALKVAHSIKYGDYKKYALQASAGKLAENGQYDQALKVAHSIEDGDYKKYALEAIAFKLAKNGQYDQALKVAHSIKDDSSKASALQAIAFKLAENGQYDQARKVAHSIEDDSSKASALQAMAEKLAKNGHYQLEVWQLSSCTITKSSYRLQLIKLCLARCRVPLKQNPTIDCFKFCLLEELRS